jgi:hypothetical protein
MTTLKTKKITAEGGIVGEVATLLIKMTMTTGGSGRNTNQSHQPAVSQHLKSIQ